MKESLAVAKANGPAKRGDSIRQTALIENEPDPAHHKTGAGDNAFFVRLDDSAVNPVTLTKVVRIHDEMSFSSHYVNSLRAGSIT